MGWYFYEAQKPLKGSKIIIACNDGCSSSLAYVAEAGILDGECGEPLHGGFMDGSVWTYLPDDFEIAFMQITPGDWL